MDLLLGTLLHKHLVSDEKPSHHLTAVDMASYQCLWWIQVENDWVSSGAQTDKETHCDPKGPLCTSRLYFWRS